MKNGLRRSAVFAIVIGFVLAMAGPAHAAHFGYLRTQHYYDIENLFINRSDITLACEAYIQVDAKSRGVHPDPVALSFDKLALMMDGIQVAVKGYTHVNGFRIHIGTSAGSGWFARSEATPHLWQAKVTGIRVRYADGYLSGSQSAQSRLWNGYCGLPLPV